MYCPKCGKAADESVRFCPGCGAQIGAGFVPAEAAYPTGGYPQTKLVRPRYPRMIAGVCAAFALQYKWDLTLVRLITAVLAVFTSGGFGLAYLIAWVVIPEAPYALPPQSAGYAGAAPPAGDATDSTGNPAV